MVPDGWNILKIEEFAEVKTGGTPSRQIPSYWNGSIPWMASGEIHQRYIKNTAEFITAEGLNNSNTRWLPEKTVMIALNGQGKTRGSVGILQTSVTCNQSLAGFIVNHQVCHPEYLFFYLDDKYQFLRDLSGDEGRNGLNLKLLREIEVSLPPLSEQKKIAEILSSVDEAITATQAVIDQTRKVKQGLIQQLLTRGIGHMKFKESAIGNIPADWDVKTAQDICLLISVGIVVKPSQYYVKSGIPCFRSANVQEGYIKDEDWVYISEESNKILSKSQLKAGDVLIVRSGYPGTSCVVTEKFDKSNCIDIIFARPNTDLMLPEYLSCFINSSLGKNQVLQAQGGLAQQHFNVGALNSMKINVPPIKEQEKIIEIFSKYQEQILQSEIEVNTLQKIKQGLMQDLLTGRVRVGVTS
ncbi:type I restriction-modification enzyme S subunit (plasmid) [Nostoc sp. NIES-2111]|nr:type I restriction-modification enzyme S subunit [Nostoc sp. NIES-2111]